MRLYNFISNLFGVLFYLILLSAYVVFNIFSTGDFVLYFRGDMWAYSILCGAFSYGVSIFFLLATKLEKPSRLASLEFIGVLFGYMFDVVSGYQLSLLEIACFILLAISGFIVFRLKDIDTPHFSV